jgi:hypothetical protein
MNNPFKKPAKNKSNYYPEQYKDTHPKFWTFAEGGHPGKLLHFFRPGEEGRRHVVTFILATLKNGGKQLFTIQDEGQMILRNYCHGTLQIEKSRVFRSGKAVQITLNIHEDQENVASLTVWGYTEDWPAEKDNVIP